jgi:hypothetical protein
MFPQHPILDIARRFFLMPPKSFKSRQSPPVGAGQLSNGAAGNILAVTVVVAVRPARRWFESNCCDAAIVGEPLPVHFQIDM